MKECIFCQIVKREIRADIVYEDTHILAFRDINPQAPIHLLIIPKKHIMSLSESSDVEKNLFAEIFSLVKKFVEEGKISRSGFRVVVNNGPDAGQAVPHLHFHLLAGRRFNWPPG